MIYLCDYKKEELRVLLQEHCPEKYRIDQIWDWIYKKNITDFSKMRNIPSGIRQNLLRACQAFPVSVAQVQSSRDGTKKILYKTRLGDLFEGVLIPQARRLTLCVSSQVGCALGCAFCATGLMGFKRNLATSEIVGQAVLANMHCEGSRISNVVIMGMGEPLGNLSAVLKAAEILNSPKGMNIGARKITISTAGIADKIEELANFPLQVRLSVSLHAVTDEKRGRIMPINKKFNLSKLFSSIEKYVKKTKRKVTFEYILFKGLNDSPEDAKLLARRVKNVCHSVNLIGYNYISSLGFVSPGAADMKRFSDILKSNGIGVTVRRQRGADISAACGQLAIISSESM